MENYKDPIDGHSYALPPELLKAAQEEEGRIRGAIEHVEGNYLVHRQVLVLQFKDNLGVADITSSDLARFFSPLVRSRAHDSAAATPQGAPVVSLTDKAGKTILRFLSLYFDQIRDMVCKGNKKSLSAPAHAGLVALAGWLSSHLGVERHEATAAAAAILIAILIATKGAFCKMTASEAKSALDSAAKPRQ
jgi:hypothetical protein